MTTDHISEDRNTRRVADAALRTVGRRAGAPAAAQLLRERAVAAINRSRGELESHGSSDLFTTLMLLARRRVNAAEMLERGEIV